MLCLKEQHMPGVTKKREISDDEVDELLKDYENPEDLLGPDGIFKALKKCPAPI